MPKPTLVVSQYVESKKTWNNRPLSWRAKHFCQEAHLSGDRMSHQMPMNATYFSSVKTCIGEILQSHSVFQRRTRSTIIGNVITP